MGKSSGSSRPQQVSSTVTQSSLPEYAEPYYRKMMQKGEALLALPYQSYGGQRIAGFQPEQLGAYQGIQAIANRALPGVDRARMTAAELAGNTQIPPVSSYYEAGQLPSFGAPPGIPGGPITILGGQQPSRTSGKGPMTGQGVSPTPDWDLSNVIYDYPNPDGTYGPPSRTSGKGPMTVQGGPPSDFAPGGQWGPPSGGLYRAAPIQRGYNAGPIYRGYDAGPIGTRYLGREFGRERIKDTMADYESPYQTAVLDRLQSRATQRAEEASAKRGLEAAKQGAFGGSRHGVEQFLADRELGEQLKDIEAQQLEKGFERAAGLTAKDIQQGMQAGQLTDESRRAAAQMGLTAQQAMEQARQTQGRMGLTAQQLMEQARQTQGRLGVTAQQATEAARQAQGRIALGGYQAQEQARQAAGRMGLQAQMANQQAFQDQQRRRLAAAQLLPQISKGEQMLDLQRMQALQDVGGQFQQLRQRQLAQGVQDFLNQRDYPRESLAYYSSLLQGLPVEMGWERQQMQPPPNPYAQALNMGLGGMSMMRGMGV